MPKPTDIKNGRFPKKINFWKECIEQFLIKERPDLADKPTVGLFRFLEWRGLLNAEEADKLCHFAAMKNFPTPETYVRVRRYGIEKGIIRLTPEQRTMFKQEGDDTRQHFGREKRRNPLWDH